MCKKERGKLDPRDSTKKKRKTLILWNHATMHPSLMQREAQCSFKCEKDSHGKERKKKRSLQVLKFIAILAWAISGYNQFFLCLDI